MLRFLSLKMELKVWVEGIQRIVCGVTDKTTCQDVVYALAHATGKTGRFTLIERWQNNERLLAPQEHPLKVLQKWGKYSQDVQFILQRSSLDAGNRPGPLSPTLLRSKLQMSREDNGRVQPSGQAQNSRILDTPSAMWKSPPGGTGNGGLHQGQKIAANARLSPDSGRGSDKTVSDTSNSYISEKEMPKSRQGSKIVAQASQSNGILPSGFNVQRSLSTSQMPYKSEASHRPQHDPQVGNYLTNWKEPSSSFNKQTSVPNLRHLTDSVVPPSYRPPPVLKQTVPQRNSSPADPPPYRAPPPPPSQNCLRYRSGSPSSQLKQQQQPVRPPRYSPPPNHRSPHFSRHPSRASLSNYQQQIQQQKQLQLKQQKAALTEYNELMNLVTAQRDRLQSQQSIICQYESEVAYFESVLQPLQSFSIGSSHLPSSQENPAGNNSQLELVLHEVCRLEEAAFLNDEELRQMSLEQQQLMGIPDSDNIEIRNEISHLKHRLAGTDQELQRTNHTLRRIGDEMCHMSIEKSRQREHELQIEMDRLQAEIKTLQIAAEESENISQQLSKQVQEVEYKIVERKAEVEKLIEEMREANMESLAISPPEGSNQFLDGPSNPGEGQTMTENPRQVESTVPTSKNQHRVWV